MMIRIVWIISLLGVFFLGLEVDQLLDKQNQSEITPMLIRDPQVIQIQKDCVSEIHVLEYIRIEIGDEFLFVVPQEDFDKMKREELIRLGGLVSLVMLQYQGGGLRADTIAPLIRRLGFEKFVQTMSGTYEGNIK